MSAYNRILSPLHRKESCHLLQCWRNMRTWLRESSQCQKAKENSELTNLSLIHRNGKKHGSYQRRAEEMLDQNTVSGFQNEAVVRLGCAAMPTHLTSPNFIRKSRQDGKCYNFNIVLKFKKKSLCSLKQKSHFRKRILITWKSQNTGEGVH